MKITSFAKQLHQIATMLETCDECGERNTTVRFVDNEHRTCFACVCCSPKEAA